MTDDDFDELVGTSNGQTSASIPPYIPFQTFLTFLKELKTNGLPPQIDKSVMSKLSGGTQSQLKVALRSLGLMHDNKPTPDMAALVDAVDTPQFDDLLRKLLERTYPYVFALDLMTATPQMFGDSFKVTGAKEDVLRKCRTFFLHAAKRVGVPLGQRLQTGSVPRSTSGTSRKRKAKPKDDVVTPPPNPPLTPMSDKAMEYKLIDLLKDGEINDEERGAIWTLVQYLARKAKAAA
jgi:hypothetical protein